MNTDVEKRYLNLQRERQFALNILAQLALQLIDPRNVASKPEIESKIRKASFILKEIDDISLSLVDMIDASMIIKLING